MVDFLIFFYFEFYETVECFVICKDPINLLLGNCFSSINNSFVTFLFKE